MGDRSALMAWVRIPMNDQQAESDVEEIFSTLEGSVEPNTILKYSSVSCSTEKISKFSDQSYKVLAYKIDVKGRNCVQSVREALIRRWRLRFELKVKHPSRSSGSSHHFDGVRLRFGNLVSPHSIVTEGTSVTDSLSLSLDHASRQVSLFVNHDSLSGTPFSKLCFLYKNVRRLIISVEKSEIILCFQLLNGPSLWQSRFSAKRQKASDPGLALRDAFFQRSSSIPASGFDLSAKESEDFKTLMVTLPDNQKLSSLYKIMHRIRQHGEVYFTRLEVLPNIISSGMDIMSQLSSLASPETFATLYPVLACISYSAELRHRLEHREQTGEMLMLIQSHLEDEASRKALKDAFEDVLFSLESGDIVDPLLTAKSLIEVYSNKPKRIAIIPDSSATALVRRVIITPGRILYRPAELHASNRILRNYEAEYAITVSFRDHDFQKLTFSGVELVPDVVTPILTGGLKILGRSYEMLASSSSQLRDHVMWMYAKDSSGRTADDIRNEMGNFSQISNVAKKMARMGQTLSSTQKTIDIAEDEYEVVDDVTWPDAVHPESGKPYCFSDGVGTISTELMNDVAACLGEQADIPSAIQIRFKGCKGMLSLDTRLSGRKMRLRKSMEKFTCPAASADSPKWPLEVIQRSCATPLFLNRQLIPLLEHHGIRTKIVHQFQLNMVFSCAQSLIHQKEALKKLLGYVKQRLPFKNMWKSGWDLLADPFCNSMLYHLFFESLKNVRDKARIAVPFAFGRNMLGVMDETGILDYGQVFVQFTSKEPEDEGRAQVVQGKVLMSKCPCVHPGDVRVLTAVDVPELRALKDCVVFPSRGKRPHPQEMAGSDLDGDEYIVIWDQKFIFQRPNVEPFVYADVAAREPRTFTKMDEARFFVKYIQNDIIGIASSAHMALADSFGFDNKKCLNLVEKISAALDFAKTEEPVRISFEERATKYPDFMANSRFPSYTSRKALGELYRTIRVMIPEETKPNSHGRVSPMEVPGWEQYAALAKDARVDYESYLSAIMQQHGISSEAELFTGVISKHSRFNSMKHDKENAEIVIGKQCEHLLKTTRKRFDEEVESLVARAEPEDEEGAMMIKRQLASAWFMAVHGKSEDSEGSFFSFPWSIASILAQTLKWLKDQPNYRGTPIEENVLLSALERKFNSGGHTLNTFMRDLLKTDNEASSLNFCSCFSKIVDHYELEVSACALSVPEKILLFMKKVIDGEFEDPSNFCLKNCKPFLRPAQHLVPRISVILSKLYLRMCVNKGAAVESIPDEEEPFMEETAPFDIETYELRDMLLEDRNRDFEISIGRLRSWTNIDDVEIRLRRRRRGKLDQVVFAFSGTLKQVEDMYAVLRDDHFEYAFVRNDKSLLSSNAG